MNQNEVESAQKRARANYELIGRKLPLHLKQQEDQLLSVFINHKGNSLTKLHDLYKFTDDIFGFIGKYVPCKKGCTHCCHFPVSVSDLEIRFIEKFARIKSSRSSGIGEQCGIPCPFLIKNACSIYSYRPFVCRNHVTLDESPKWCHIDVCNDIKLTFIKFSEIFRVYDYILQGSGMQQRLDIREAFASRK